MAGRRAPRARPPQPRSRHFLRSAALAAQLVRESGVGPDDLAVDLGAGSGRITGALAAAAGRVVAVELDPGLAARLRGRWGNVDVVQGDAAVLELPTQPFRVVANLPFSRTTDLLHRLLDDPATPLVRADLVVEWAVAVHRGVPSPSSLHGAYWGAFYEAAIARRLPARAFDPPPRVDAGVLVFRRRPRPLVPPDLAGAYRTVLARGFRHGPRAVAPRRDVTAVAGAAATARELDAHQWAELFLRSGAGEARARSLRS